MKGVSYGMTVTLGLMLILSTVIPSQSGMMGQRPVGPSVAAAESPPAKTMGMVGQGAITMMRPQARQHR